MEDDNNSTEYSVESTEDHSADDVRETEIADGEYTDNTENANREYSVDTKQANRKHSAEHGGEHRAENGMDHGTEYVADTEGTAADNGAVTDEITQHTDDDGVHSKGNRNATEGTTASNGSRTKGDPMAIPACEKRNNA